MVFPIQQNNSYDHTYHKDSYCTIEYYSLLYIVYLHYLPFYRTVFLFLLILVSTMPINFDYLNQEPISCYFLCVLFSFVPLSLEEYNSNFYEIFPVIIRLLIIITIIILLRSKYIQHRSVIYNYRICVCLPAKLRHNELTNSNYFNLLNVQYYAQAVVFVPALLSIVTFFILQLKCV